MIRKCNNHIQQSNPQRENQRTLTVTGNQKNIQSNKICQPQQEDCKILKGTKYCTAKQVPNINFHEQWEQQKAINQQHQNHRPEMDSNQSHWGLKCS